MKTKPNRLEKPVVESSKADGSFKTGKFCVGVVYRSGTRYFLGIDDDRLLTFVDGLPKAIRPIGFFEALRDFSLKSLLGEWCIDASTLDSVMIKFLDKPQPVDVFRFRSSGALPVCSLIVDFESRRTAKISRWRKNPID